MAAVAVTAANVLTSGEAGGAVIKNVTIAAGVTVTQGQALYKLANGTYGLCDADASLLASTFAGFALSGGSPGQQIRMVESDPLYTPGGTLVKGSALYTSATAGGFTITASDNSSGVFAQVIGMSISTTQATIGPGFAAGSAI